MILEIAYLKDSFTLIIVSALDVYLVVDSSETHGQFLDVLLSTV